MSNESNTDLWIELTKIAASVEYLRTNSAELNGKLDERNKIMREELKQLKSEFRKEFLTISERVEKLETSKTKVIGAWTFMGIIGGFIAWGVGLYKGLF